MNRTIDQWKEILANKAPKDAAKRILGDLTHYYHDRPYEQSDINELANALEAYKSNDKSNQSSNRQTPTDKA